MSKAKSPSVYLAECTVTWKDIAPGVTAFFCFSPRVPHPVGTVYAFIAGQNDGGKTQAMILDSFVTSWARRQGVRSLINEKIFEAWGADVITSPSGTKEGGKAFMKAAGYKIEPRTGVWYLERPKAKKKRGAA